MTHPYFASWRSTSRNFIALAGLRSSYRLRPCGKLADAHVSGSYRGKYAVINVDLDVGAFRGLHSSGAIRRSVPGPPTYNQPVADEPGLRHPVHSCPMCVRPNCTNARQQITYLRRRQTTPQVLR